MVQIYSVRRNDDLKRLKSIAAIILCLAMCFGVGIVSVSATEKKPPKPQQAESLSTIITKAELRIFTIGTLCPQILKQAIPV